MFFFSCNRRTALPPPNEEVMEHVKEEGMSCNIVPVLEKIGAFSTTTSTLTPESTMDEIHEYLTVTEDSSQILMNSPEVTKFSNELLQYVDERIRVIKGVDNNDIPMYISVPDGTSPKHAILHFHPGAMAIMSAKDQVYRAWCRLLAKQGFMVASVDFRNCSGGGERTPFPGALNDCVSALEWLIGKKEIEKITLCGECGGANLAIATCVRAVKKGVSKDKIDGAVLWYPSIAGPSVWKDWETSDCTSLKEHDGVCGLANDWLYTGLTYTPDEANWTVGEAWPTFLTDDEINMLPPIALHTSDIDMLRDEGINFSKRLAKAEKLVTHTNHKGNTHCIHMTPVHPDLNCLMVIASKYVKDFANRRELSWFVQKEAPCVVS